MKISANIQNSLNQHEVSVKTNGAIQKIAIPSKASGYGSSVNGGELLLLALATCFCNDIYREAAKRKIPVAGVEVEVTGDFGGEGEPGSNFQYKVRVEADAAPDEINVLIRDTDKIAEIHNTLRKGLAVTLLE